MKIAAVLIVKDEAHCVVRCLDSLREFVNKIYISDTGSTDGTQQVIKDWALGQDTVGIVLGEEKWVNFAHNRNKVLEMIPDGEFDYYLSIDADAELIVDPFFDRESLTRPFYRVRRFDEVEDNWSEVLWKPGTARWVGVIHESLFPCITEDAVPLNGLSIREYSDSARNRAGGKYLKDIETIKKALAINGILDMRYRFHLAQSYQCQGDFPRAMATYEDFFKRYEKNIACSGEFLWYALFVIAMIKERLKYPDAEIIEAYRAAIVQRPIRIESYLFLGNLLLSRGHVALAEEIYNRIKDMRVPWQDGMRVQSSLYTEGKAEFAETIRHAKGER